jgi:hypothetical protein
MTTPEIGFLIGLGAVLLFALIGAIIINHSLKQEKRRKAALLKQEEERKAAFFQKFWGDK